MPTPPNPNARSVKIPSDERGGWSSDRPRREGAPPRLADVSVRSRVLQPTDQQRYAPGSLLLLASPSPDDAEQFASRAVEGKGNVLSLAKVRALLAQKLGEEEAASRAGELLDAAVAKRLESGEAVALPLSTLGADERERYVRMAHAHRRPRHLILLEAARDQVQDEDRATLNDLRKRLDAGQLGEEGFATVMRLGGQSVGELKRIVFRDAPRDD
jgi:predicted kinase